MILCILIIVLGIAADVATKQLAIAYLAGNESFPLIDSILHLTYVENRGAAFGMLADKRWIFMTVSVIAVIALLVYLIVSRPKPAMVRASLSLIIAGGAGNLIDRFMLGYVVDFIDVRAIDFYVFNVADSMVCVGSGLLIIWIIASEIADAKKKNKASAAAASAATASAATASAATAAAAAVSDSAAESGTSEADTSDAPNTAAAGDDTVKTDGADSHSGKADE